MSQQNNPEFFDGEYLTDNALLTSDLIPRCSFSTTQPRDVPANMNTKNPDFSYITKNMRVTYPGCAPCNTIIIPNCVMHKETFEHFGKTGVFLGVPQSWVQMIRTKLMAAGVKPLFEDPGVASDEKYWWSKVGFDPAPAEDGKEYVFFVTEVNGEIQEIPYGSFPELFKEIGTSVIVNLTCTVSLTAKIPKDRQGAVTPNDEWRVKVSPISCTIKDFIEINKPSGGLKQRSLPGRNDVASPQVQAMLKRLGHIK